MIRIKQRGNFSNSERFFKKVISRNPIRLLDKYARAGVEALARATPVESGETANSWNYEIINNKDSYKIVWKNSNVVDGVAIAILLQYGHATRNGGFIQGIDYINPVIKPLFEKIANEAWREVTNL